MYFNTRSIVNKIDLLRGECATIKPDVILVTESFCRKDITDAYLVIDGYQMVVRKDGTDTEGGKCRGLLVRIPWGRREEFQIVCVDRPPTTPLSELD